MIAACRAATEENDYSLVEQVMTVSGVHRALISLH
jgi:hypothetical protein